jgi:hypothetical protein
LQLRPGPDGLIFLQRCSRTRCKARSRHLGARRARLQEKDADRNGLGRESWDTEHEHASARKIRRRSTRGRLKSRKSFLMQCVGKILGRANHFFCDKSRIGLALRLLKSQAAQLMPAEPLPGAVRNVACDSAMRVSVEFWLPIHREVVFLGLVQR